MKSVFLFIVSFVLGAAFNSLILTLGMEIIPPPSGYDMNNAEDLAKAMSVMETKHYLFPFLSHSLGTLIGVVFYTYFSKAQKLFFPLLMAGFYFAGGLYMVLILPSPLWFDFIDLILAYFPMAILGFKLSRRNT
jgi:hypothetical protein